MPPCPGENGQGLRCVPGGHEHVNIRGSPCSWAAVQILDLREALENDDRNARLGELFEHREGVSPHSKVVNRRGKRATRL
jgi:hypothetical protein